MTTSGLVPIGLELELVLVTLGVLITLKDLRIREGWTMPTKGEARRPLWWYLRDWGHITQSRAKIVRLCPGEKGFYFHSDYSPLLGRAAYDFERKRSVLVNLIWDGEVLLSDNGGKGAVTEFVLIPAISVDSRMDRCLVYCPVSCLPDWYVGMTDYSGLRFSLERRSRHAYVMTDQGRTSGSVSFGLPEGEVIAIVLRYYRIEI